MTPEKTVLPQVALTFGQSRAPGVSGPKVTERQTTGPAHTHPLGHQNETWFNVP